jgi:hypothetical protein
MSEDIKSKPNPPMDSSEKKARRKKEKHNRDESMQTDLYVDSMLMKNEEIVVSCDVHWGIYWKSGALFFIALLVGLLIAPELGFILLVASFIGAVHSFFLTRMLLLVLTNKRVLMRYGILQVDVVDMRFKNIESIELERMLPGFLLGYSNVIVMGIGNRSVRIPYLTNGVTFRRAFNELVLGTEEEEAEDAVQEEQFPPSKKADKSVY